MTNNLSIKITPLGNQKFVVEFVRTGVKIVGNPIIIDDNFLIDHRVVGEEIVKTLKSGQVVYLETKLSPKQ